MRALDREGGNYRIEIDERVIVLTIWSRPDVDAATGARWAAEAMARVSELAATPGRGVVLDVRDAPTVAGPETARRLEQVFIEAERAGLRMAVLVSDRSMQQLQWTRIVRSHARTTARVCELEAEALAWATGQTKAS